MNEQPKTKKATTNRLSWRNLSLYSQLAILITLLISTVVFTLSYLTIESQRESNAIEIRRTVLSRLDTLIPSSIDAMYLSDVDTLDNIGDRMENSPAVISVTYFDSTGRVVAVSGDNPFESYLGTLTIPPESLAILNTEGLVFNETINKATGGLRVSAGRQVIGAIFIEISTEEYHRNLEQLQQQSILIGLVALALGIVVALFVSRILANPLEKLVQATQRIASGDFDQVINLNPTGKEIAQLSNSLEFMRSELKTLYGNLEEQVKERTRELATTNETLQQTNKDLELAQQVSEDANRLKSEFLATMSHELRTPLNSILGYSGLLVMGIYGELPNPAVEKIKAVEESGQHLLALINDVLDISKIEAGRMKLVEEPLLLNDLIERLASRINILANKKELEFKHQLDPSLPDTIIGDSERLAQICTNLLSNAVKFTNKGEVNLEIRQKPEDAEKWQIIVKDTGVGIPKEAQEYIFDEFRQVDGSYTRVHGGTGLGLAITRKLVITMSGSISLDSEVGKGSTFTITLPLKTIQESEASPEEAQT